MDQISGLGTDVPTTQSQHGGYQSNVPFRMDLIDARAWLALGNLMHIGIEASGYKPDNWRAISIDDHLNHALTHIVGYLSGDRSDNHLLHALCRTHFALGVAYQGGPDETKGGRVGQRREPTVDEYYPRPDGL